MDAMRTWSKARLVGALVAWGAAAIGSMGCSESKGQLMFVFQTDMSLPKDIDAVRILATLEGEVVYDQTYQRLGTEEGIRLPATLGFFTPDDPTRPIQLRVTATQGGGDNVRVLREVVSTVPEDRTVMLHVPIQLLCFGSGEAERDELGNVKHDASGAVVVKNSCGDGKTCVAGSCEDAAVPSDDLLDFAAARVFGGGSGDGDGLCFDTVQCFLAGASVALDSESFAADPTLCRALAPGGGSENNVAFLTQGGGICGGSACYVPLDAESDSGWRLEQGGWIRLPKAVCEKTVKGEILGLVVAPAAEGTCRKKESDLPTCGSWAASGTGEFTVPDQRQPLPLVLGLVHPVGLAVTPDGVYWTESGSFDADGVPRSDGAVKWVPPGGGQPLVLAKEQQAPRDLVVDAAAKLVFWTSAGGGVDDGAIMAATPEVGAVTLLPGRLQPEGIARVGQTLFWTEQWKDQVLRVDTAGVGPQVAAQGAPGSLTEGGSLGVSPYRLSAASDVVCWTYQGTLQALDGAVACRRSDAAAQVIAPQQSTPRAIALDVDPSGSARAVYWASFEGGTISRVDLGGEPYYGEPKIIAENQALPSGLAVDTDFFYWTNRGDGTVMQAPKSGGVARPLASGQLRPGAIVVDTKAVYWINEGSQDEAGGTTARDGAVMRVLK
jgi:sugar lactone lactonase YvrE